MCAGHPGTPAQHKQEILLEPGNNVAKALANVEPESQDDLP